jgi:hypothetical protein
MAKKRSKRTTRAVVRKPKRKTSAAKGVVRKPKRKASAVKVVAPKPQPKPYPDETVAKGLNPNVATVKPVVIEPRRQVETSDALLFPSGRPMRKR